MGPTTQPTVHPSVFLSVEVSIYTGCHKQYTEKSCSDRVYVYASASQFLSYLPKGLDQGITLIFNPSHFILPTCNLSFFSAEKHYIQTLQSR